MNRNQFWQQAFLSLLAACSNSQYVDQYDVENSVKGADMALVEFDRRFTEDGKTRGASDDAAGLVRPSNLKEALQRKAEREAVDVNPRTPTGKELLP